jgi:hypothetical protein
MSTQTILEHVFAICQTLFYEHGPLLWAWIAWGLHLRKAQFFAACFATASLVLLPSLLATIWSVVRWLAINIWAIICAIAVPVWSVICPVVVFVWYVFRAIVTVVVFIALLLAWLNLLDWISTHPAVLAFFKDSNHTFFIPDLIRKVMDLYHHHRHF